MAASQATVKQILDIMRRHIKDEQVVKAVIGDLEREIQGSMSVRHTLKKLKRSLK